MVVGKPGHQGQQILASPLVSNDSNMPSQALLNHHQLAKCHQPGHTNGNNLRNIITPLAASLMQNRSSSGSKGVGGCSGAQNN